VAPKLKKFSLPSVLSKIKKDINELNIQKLKEVRVLDLL